VRVVGGRLGGQRLVAPRGRATRPTPERVREALFSILGSVQDERVLDLFAGSGGLGIEALSRGAAQATFVDSSAAAVRAVQRNLERLGLAAEVQPRGVLGFLQWAGGAGRQYDLVFVDPPYRQASSLARELATALTPVLAADARVVVESDRRMPLQLEPLCLTDERRYGDTLLRIYANGP
jgi:16S rRNA (guanine966-N2)-methyltransferase